MRVIVGRGLEPLLDRCEPPGQTPPPPPALPRCRGNRIPGMLRGGRAMAPTKPGTTASDGESGAQLAAASSGQRATPRRMPAA
jgi:hypothetical protein